MNKIKEKYVIKYDNEYLKEIDKNRKIRFIPLTYDQMFKKVFGNNKQLLKRFLISVLRLDISMDECIMEIGVNEQVKERYNDYGSKIDINIMLNDIFHSQE